MTKHKGEFQSMIAATLHISETEIAKFHPDYKYQWVSEEKQKLEDILHSLGLDTSQYWEYQEPCQHRNRLNQVVTSGRFYGTERTDEVWLNSGLASTAAKDKSRNSRLTDDLYRQRAMTIDTQMALENRDLYNLVEEDIEEVW